MNNAQNKKTQSGFAKKVIDVLFYNWKYSHYEDCILGFDVLYAANERQDPLR